MSRRGLELVISTKELKEFSILSNTLFCIKKHNENAQIVTEKESSH
jgi:hypothetical protein